MAYKNSIILLIGILLSGCFAGNSGTDHKTTRVKNLSAKTLSNNNPNNIYAIGGTYDSMSNHPTKVYSCLKAGADINNIQIHNPHASLNFSQEQDLQSVQRALSISFSLKLGAGPFTIHKSYSYARTSRDDAYSMNLNYIYQLAGTAKFKDEVLQQGESALNLDAQNELHYSKTGFRQMCGDHFISEATAGASVLIRLKLHFNSATEKKSFNQNFTQIGGLNNILNSIKNHAPGSSYSLSAQGIQVGGNPALLDQIFLNNGGEIGVDGYPTLDCGSGLNDTSPQCVNLINQVLNYVTSLGSQFTSLDSYYLSQPTLSTWAQAGIYAGSVNPSKELESAMYQLTNLYQTDENNLLFIQNYQNMLDKKNILSPQMLNDLNQLANAYTKVLAVYTDPNYNIMDCYNGFISDDCLVVRDRIVTSRQNILNNQALNNLLTYLITHQYLVKLWITPVSQAICEIVPITDSSLNLYGVNCDGQLSGSFDTSTGLHITQSYDYQTEIRNFKFSYFDGQTTNNISYFFQDPLNIDNEYENSFFGIGLVNINNQSSFYVDDFFLVNVVN